VGGIVFGVGMVLARGCPSRLIVLAASGNLRAAVTLLILALVVQATLSGALVPARQAITPVAMLSPAEQSAFLSVSATAVLAVIGALMIGAIIFARNVVGRLTYALAAIGTGLTIPLAWFLTAAISQQTFDPFEPQAVSYAAPTAMAVAGRVDLDNATPSYGLGLLGGAFVGAFLIAVATGTFRVVQFAEGATLPRYAAGAVLMGFGSVLCLGCAVGAGMTGASVLATHALVALASMVLGAGVADWAERGIAAARARRSTPLDDLYPARQQTTGPRSGLVAAE
ncbi:MAG: YeeE/YedE family protein, partial [Pseudomonadota bacterium]